MTERELPGALRRSLDAIPPSVIAQYLAGRLDAGVGRRQLLVAVADGRYQAGYVGIPVSEWRDLQPHLPQR